MASIGRGQTNTPDRLRLFRVDGAGQPENPFAVSFQIFDDTSGTPVQVFPASGFEVVTSGPGRFDTGAFYAYDNASGRGWRPLDDANLGAWHIEWTIQIASADAPFIVREDFDLVASAAHASDPLYIGVMDLRAEGIPSSVQARKIESEIRAWQAYILRSCRQWFHPAYLVLTPDGTDSDAIHLGVPIIQLDELRINNSPDALDPAYYKVYSGRERYPDNRANPRIKLVDEFCDSRDIFTAPMSSATRRFLKGRQNQYLAGTFGYVEPDGSVPDMIKRALVLLTVEKVTTPIYAAPAGVTPPAILSGVIVEEQTDGHRVKYDTSQLSTTPRAPGNGVTFNSEVQGIIRMYRAPIGIATTADTSAAR